jgi:hypothetical protein
MKTLRASNGSTSSGATFWLMAAMRMKDRRGPGMATVSTAGEGGLAEPMPGWSDALTALPELAEEQRHRPKKAERKMAVRRGHFIMGYLF